MKPLLLLLTTITLLSCERPESGVVVDKKHTAAWTSWSVIYVDDLPVPCPRKHPEEWTLTISGKISNGKTRPRSMTVGSGTYEAYNVGDPYPKAER